MTGAEPDGIDAAGADWPEDGRCIEKLLAAPEVQDVEESCEEDDPDELALGDHGLQLVPQDELLSVEVAALEG